MSSSAHSESDQQLSALSSEGDGASVPADVSHTKFSACSCCINTWPLGMMEGDVEKL